MGCYESNLGPKPWGKQPASRCSIRNVASVIGYFILYYGNSDRRLQINEVFEILDGRVRLIDNIGLTEDRITTSGFTD